MDVAITFASILAPVVLALVQVVKASFPLPKNLVPLLGLILGIIVGGLAYPFTDLTVPIRLWSGAIAGLISVGLFETFNTRTGLTITKEYIYIYIRSQYNHDSRDYTDFYYLQTCSALLYFAQVVGQYHRAQKTLSF